VDLPKAKEKVGRKRGRRGQPKKGNMSQLPEVCRPSLNDMLRPSSKLDHPITRPNPSEPTTC
jgi:hypothetical protein